MQKAIKDELTSLQKLKSDIQANLNKNKQILDEIKKEMAKELSPLNKNKILKEIIKDKQAIQPVQLELNKKNLETMEKKRISNEIKEDLIIASYSEDLSEHLDYSIRLKNALKEIDYLNEQIKDYDKKMNEKQEKLNKLITFKFPAKGVFTSMYGWRKDPFHEKALEWHTGVDIAGSGDILSVLNGTVVYVGCVNGYGNYIEIDHGVINGIKLKTRYAHLASIYVKKGQSIEKGQAIGLMGTTGHSTGVHLHFEVLENGERVDPKPYLDKAIAY